jgi:hypothetical protein
MFSRTLLTSQEGIHHKKARQMSLLYSATTVKAALKNKDRWKIRRLCVRVYSAEKVVGRYPRLSQP